MEQKGKTVVVVARVDKETGERIEAIALETDRSISYIAKKLIKLGLAVYEKDNSVESSGSKIN